MINGTDFKDKREIWRVEANRSDRHQLITGAKIIDIIRMRGEVDNGGI